MVKRRKEEKKWRETSVRLKSRYFDSSVDYFVAILLGKHLMIIREEFTIMKLYCRFRHFLAWLTEATLSERTLVKEVKRYEKLMRSLFTNRNNLEKKWRRRNLISQKCSLMKRSNEIKFDRVRLEWSLLTKYTAIFHAIWVFRPIGAKSSVYHMKYS